MPLPDENVVNYVEKYELITSDVMFLILISMLFVVFLSAITLKIVYFIPSFINSFVRSIKNKKILESDYDALDTKLDGMTFKYKRLKKGD